MHHSTTSKQWLTIAAVAACAGFGAAAQGGTSLDAADRKFVTEAASGGMTEVELGKLAQQQAANAQVKEFGSRMAQDHAKANEELKRIADAKGVPVPAQPDAKHQKDIERLRGLSGAAFDREYMKHMVADHKKDVAEFQKESRSAKDNEVKDFATRTLPTLQEHLKMAERTHDTVKRAKTASAT